MINVINSSIGNLDVFDGNIKNTLLSMSSDQIGNLNFDLLQDFLAQKEIQYKKDYDEFISFRDLLHPDSYNYKQMKEQVLNKYLELRDKYSFYIPFDGVRRDLDQDFGNTCFSKNTVSRQYSFINKKEYNGNDFQILIGEKIARLFPDALGGFILIGDKDKRNAVNYNDYKTLEMESILSQVKLEINKSYNNRLNSTDKNKFIYSKNIKLHFIKLFIGLKYLLIQAEKDNNIQDVSLIKDTIDYLLDFIKNIDDIIINPYKYQTKKIIDVIK